MSTNKEIIARLSRVELEAYLIALGKPKDSVRLMSYRELQAAAEDLTPAGVDVTPIFYQGTRLRRPSATSVSLGLYDSDTPLDVKADKYIWGTVDSYGDLQIIRHEDLMYITRHWAPVLLTYCETYDYH